ncbi:MAG TPA: OadG family protein [Prolixibacteraceae bacterium]|nr:OadG family protein [Prolixibacteraceae bacterium]
MSEMEVALELLGVGMVTVFIILSLVVLIGNLIIRFVNKYMAEDIKPPTIKSGTSSVEINSKKLAAIVSAVNIVTNGAGRVTDVKKI